MRLGTLAAWLLGWLAYRFSDDRERSIFGFWDGQKWRRVDPLPVFRALDSDPEFNSSRDAQAADEGDPAACARAVAATRRAFNLPEFDGTRGLTETECLLLLADFWQFCGDIKKKANPSQISRPVTEPDQTQGWTPEPDPQGGGA